MVVARSPRVVVLLEGQSDVAAVRTLAAARGLPGAGSELELVDMGGVTNVRRHLGDLLARRRPPRVLGLCDAREQRFFKRALLAHGVSARDTAAMGSLGFHVCDRDLEDELIRALGAEVVLALLEDLRLGDRFATLQQQPAWRGQPLPAQLRRFAGVASGRKALFAAALAAALRPEQVPPPLAALLDQVASALEAREHPPGCGGTALGGARRDTRRMEVMDFAFEGPVVEWRGPAPYYFVAIPEEDSDDIKLAARGLEYWGQVPVSARIDGVEFTTALFPKDGRYLLPVKAAVRRSAELEVDQVVAVALDVGRG